MTQKEKILKAIIYEKLSGNVLNLEGCELQEKTISNTRVCNREAFDKLKSEGKLSFKQSDMLDDACTQFFDDMINAIVKIDCLTLDITSGNK